MTLRSARQEPLERRVPVNADTPSDITIQFADKFDDHASPIDARGIGELGATGVEAAVANAVNDAIGVRVRELPILPSKLLGNVTPSVDVVGEARVSGGVR